MSSIFQPVEEKPVANIMVIGVGGGGGNAINTMVECGLQRVTFVAANTDLQALKDSRADKSLQLGPGITRGMGAGADPERGKEAAQESYDEIREMIKGSDMVFITAGLGGGTGTGAAPLIAKASKEAGALTVAVVTKPFFFEAKRRMKNAEVGWEQLRRYVDTIITVPNDRLQSIMQKTSLFEDMMHQVDLVLYHAVKGISDLINQPGFINVDFADLKAVMKEVGPAVMGSGSSSGENRAREAALKAIDNPLLEDTGIDGAKALLVNISCARASLAMNEYVEANALLQEKVHEDANVITGVIFDESLGDEMRVTVIATGISAVEATDDSIIHEVLRKVEAVPVPVSVRPVEPTPEGNGTRYAEPNRPSRVAIPDPFFDERMRPREETELDKPAYIRKQAN
ncbi:MAG: cell division protein FtsZ [Desulfobulbaceae bacterium A2]|nr:MAG: cell division protein FtsZ [Desulfobulbaceae bacterium A2]